MRWNGGSRIRWLEACLSAGAKSVHSLLADMALVRREDVMEPEERMEEYLWWRDWRRRSGLSLELPEDAFEELTGRPKRGMEI